MLEDALRERLDSEVRRGLGEPPQPDLAAVLDRGRSQRRWRTLRLSALGLVTAIGVVAGAVVLSDREQSQPPIGTERPPETATEDGTASYVIEKLGRLCRSFDFYFKVEIDGTLMRPVRCEGEPRRGLGGTVPAPPRLVIYAFSERQALDQWLKDHPQRLSGRVIGSLWAIDVPDPDEFEGVIQALAGDAEVVLPPQDAWTYGSRTLRMIDDEETTSEVLLQEALDAAVQTGEALDAILVEYSRGREEPRKVWWIRHRRCIPGYKGKHARPGCVGDETHDIVSADTGKLLERFVTP